MELKSPKAKKKSSIAKLISWGRMFKTPLLILFLLGTTNCERESEVAELDSNFKIQSFGGSHIRHKHYNGTDKNKMKDIKYLRRHLNKQIVNFVMTDFLIDGEVENRVHFNGVTAKETYVGADGLGLKLRQLTDGRHLVQVIYNQNGDIQDCEYVTQGKSARNFLKTLRKELKLALDEEIYRIVNKQPKNVEDEKFYRHFGNVTFRILKDGDRLPPEISNWLDYDKLKMECLKRHEELQYMMENKNKVGESSLARSRRSFRETFIVPGTKWCGAGHIAAKYGELGADAAEDRCCRSHDHCRLNIGMFKRRFGYFNYRPYTISHCRCDRRSKRDTMELLRVPGTKWCGKGFSATRYSQLGGHTRTDRCCRVHDLRCPFWIGGMEKKYGIYNWRVNTLMHCRCDERLEAYDRNFNFGNQSPQASESQAIDVPSAELYHDVNSSTLLPKITKQQIQNYFDRFRACLKLADTSVSNMVGKLFFNVVQTKCFILKPVKMCTQRSWWGKCLRRGYTKQAFLRDNLPY